jgi:hypothetical protein
MPSVFGRLSRSLFSLGQKNRMEPNTKRPFSYEKPPTLSVKGETSLLKRTVLNAAYGALAGATFSVTNLSPYSLDGQAKTGQRLTDPRFDRDMLDLTVVGAAAGAVVYPVYQLLK